MIAVVLAGGKGLRLWPESRQARPKQLCKLINNRSMLDHTLDRLMAAGSSQIIIITNDSLLSSIKELVQERDDARQIDILSEPEGRNTGPAVGLVLSRFYDQTQDEILGFFPADHHVLNTQAFVDSIRRAHTAAQNNHLATLGISPNRPETGYGYIEKTKWEIGEIPGVFQVNTFCEKPDLSTACSYIESGNHLWNAGIYIGKTKVLLEEFEKHLPDIYAKLILGFDNYINSYAELPDISLDYGIAEKSNRIAVVPADFGWCDLGNWNALEEICSRDNMMNVSNGKDVVLMGSSKCLIRQVEKTVVLLGVENLLVVETDDIFFVADRNRIQDLRGIEELLRQQGRNDLL